MIHRPEPMFDREVEWVDLNRFLTTDLGHLAVVWGPRRVGKSFLLSTLCEQVDGLYIQAVRQDPMPFLASLGRILGERLGVPAPLELTDWTAAVEALVSLPDTPVVVLDEFPYLADGSPELPTVVQAVLDREATPHSRLVLCGSAVSQMTRLLTSDGPLYRRAQLSLSIKPFDLRTTVRFWGLDSRPIDAVRVHAVVGGTPGYRDVLGPVDDVDSWIIQRVLDPTTSLFHEDDLVFSMDPTLPDANVYRSVLAAIVAGDQTPTGIATTTGRRVTSLGRPIDRLVDAGIVTRTPDPLRSKRALLDIADPFLRFHHAIIRPNRAALARRRGEQVWRRNSATFRSQVLGPHFEQLCRQAVLDFDLGIPIVAAVGATTLHDSERRRSHEVDVVGTDERGQVTLLGEVKASEAPRTSEDLRRLDHLRTLLPPTRRARDVHLAIFCLGGADRELRDEVAGRGDASVIDADTLCAG